MHANSLPARYTGVIGRMSVNPGAPFDLLSNGLIRQPRVDPDAVRRRRREEARRRTRRQRRIAAAAAAVALTAGIVVVGTGLPGSGEPAGEPTVCGAAGGAAARRAADPPRPHRRRVLRRATTGGARDARYRDAAAAGRRLERQARAYRGGGRPLLPAIELIATIAQSAAARTGTTRSGRPREPFAATCARRAH